MPESMLGAERNAHVHDPYAKVLAHFHAFSPTTYVHRFISYFSNTRWAIPKRLASKA